MKVKELLSYSRLPARARTRWDYAWKENGFALIATRERKRHKTRNGEKRVSLSFAPRMFAKHRSPRDPMVQYWVEPSSPMLSLSGAGGPHPLVLASMRCRLRWNVAHAGVRGLGVSALACPPSMLSLISISI